MHELEVPVRGRVSWCGTWGPLLVNVFEEFPRAEDLEPIPAITQGLIAEHGANASLTILAGRIELDIDPKLREVAAQLVAEFRDTLTAGALVVESTDLRTSFIRTVMSGVNLLSRARSPTWVFASVDEALAWLGGQDPRLAGLEPAIATAIASERRRRREALAEPPPS